MLHKNACFCLMLLLIEVVALMIVQINASTGPLLRITPDYIEDISIIPGNTIVFTIEVLNVSNMYAYEFKLFYKNSVLNVTKAVRPAGHFLQPIDPMNQFVPKWEIKNNYNSTHGRLWLSFTLLSPEPAKSGSGVLVEITFKVIGIGSTPITFKDTKLADSSGSSITHTAQSGYFSNSPPPPPAMLYIDPERLVDINLIPCQNFTVSVNIQNATSLHAFYFMLTYNPEIIEAIEIQEGEFLKSVGATSILIMEINNTHGSLRFAVTLSSSLEANGNGTLATIEFHVLEMGASPLIFQEIAISDSLGNTLPYTSRNGYFSNVIFAKISVNPAEIIDPTLIPGKMFTINITVENIENLYGYFFQLGYAPSVLTCKAVDIHPSLNETNYSSSFSVNDRTGEICVDVTLYSPANPINTIEPLTLVTLTFKVDTWGISNLTLYNTSLLDPYGNPIPHEVRSGFFQSVIRNVAITNVEVSPTVIYENYKVNITVTASNKGDLTESFNVTVYYNNIPIMSMSVSNLQSKHNTTLLFEWSTTGISPGVYTIKAEAHSVPYESDLTDNVFTDGTITINLTGDVNGDGAVDIFDLAEVGLAFGSRPGQPMWNPRADINQDGEVDIFDLVTVAINFGRQL